MAEQSDHVIRKLKFQLAQANKTMGRQGRTIHALKGELAEVRELHGKIERDDIRRLERENASLKELMDKQRDRNEQLNDQNKQLSDQLRERTSV